MTSRCAAAAAAAARVAGLLCLAAGAVTAGAADKPVFTAPLVHPVGTPPAEAAAPVARSFPPVARGHSPRTHAQEMADVFGQACIASRGDATAAIDWALAHGLTPAAADAADAGPGGAAYRRQLDAGDSLVLVVGQSPATCAVLSQQRVDAPRLRERLDRFAVDWVSPFPPPAPAGAGAPNGGGQVVAYRFAVGTEVHTLGATLPKGGSGTAILMLSIADAPAR